MTEKLNRLKEMGYNSSSSLDVSAASTKPTSAVSSKSINNKASASSNKQISFFASPSSPSASNNRDSIGSAMDTTTTATAVEGMQVVQGCVEKAKKDVEIIKGGFFYKLTVNPCLKPVGLFKTGCKFN